ncbi:hypothetical protein B0H19DRAFT_1094631 [Mycena capillaripes]|nr:hypothetical protein B0H19DRAFT_1094631 [Mycena capillaripes]
MASSCGTATETFDYEVIALVVQTSIFGVYTVLTALSTRMFLKRGLKARENRVIFIIMIFVYLLSMAYWFYSVADVVHRMRVFLRDPRNPINFTADDTLTKWLFLFNALVLVNYIFSDAIVVWRAWIICSGGYRKYLSITIVFLILTVASVTSTIIFKIFMLVKFPDTQLPKGSLLAEGVDVLQISNLAFSLISNLSATAVVGAITWQHRQEIRGVFVKMKTTKAEQTLTLIVESGVLYCISGLTILISSLIRLPHGTLADIYAPISIQIAGAYPPVVLLLVSMQKSLNETVFLNTISSPEPSGPTQSKAFGTNSEDQNERSGLGSKGESVLNSDIRDISVY